MATYYNEIDPFVSQWLRNLIAAGHIADGEVDERSVVDVQPADVRGFSQCHFFAGIGGWSYALRLAGWPDERPVWTGSCPCQPFSTAARGRTVRRQDGKHLWPIWRTLISECAPSFVLGEQVASAGDWFDGVCDDMEAMGYAIGAAILPATAIGQDHARSRIYFASHTDSNSESIRHKHAKASWMSGNRSQYGVMEAKNGIPGRMGLLRAYGNAIVPPLAAEFIKTCIEVMP